MMCDLSYGHLIHSVRGGWRGKLYYDATKRTSER